MGVGFVHFTPLRPHGLAPPHHRPDPLVSTLRQRVLGCGGTPSWRSKQSYRGRTASFAVAMANVPRGDAAWVGQRSLDDPGVISIGLAHYLMPLCTAADGTALAGVQRLVETERVDCVDAVPSSISGSPTPTTAAISVCSSQARSAETSATARP